jgi:hypothetical protein
VSPSPVSRALRLAALLTGILVTVLACSDSSPQPLTDDQAAALSQVLVRNYEAGGAEVTATVPYGVGAALQLDGVIDWVDHGGLAELTTTIDGEETDRTDVAWTESEVAVRPSGGADDEWTVRPADPDGVPLDRIIALIVASAGPERDNPLLVAQSDARWLRRDRVGGPDGDRAVDVIDGGGRLQFWIGVDDGLLYRLDADIEGFEGPTTIEYRAHGPTELDR